MTKKQELIDTPEMLREHGFRVTDLRVALLNVLAEHSKPLTAGILIKKVKRLKADTATIYRALQAFVEVELVRQLNLQDRTATYELVREHHSHHIICNSCTQIEAIPFCVRSIEINAHAKSKLFKTISAHTISFSGTCKKCAKAVR